MAKTKENTVSVLAFEKKLIPSDGLFFETVWEHRNDPVKAQPLKLNEKSVRGTISNRLGKKDKDDPSKLEAQMENANLQRVDSCMLSGEADTLQLSFTLKVLGNLEKPSVCNHMEFAQTYAGVAAAYIQKNQFTELAQRYAYNIAAGRCLWRNRVGAEAVETRVRFKTANQEQSLTFDGGQFSLHTFTSDNPHLDILAREIASALRGEQILLLHIDVFANVGKGQEVYPSEELVLDQSTGDNKNKKSKILYQVNDEQAAMHSQKIGNALRTIDTWYPDYDAAVGPIAVEPYGAVTSLGKAFRRPTDKADFYTLFDKYARGEPLERIEDEHYVMAVLVRGGVFGERDK